MRWNKVRSAARELSLTVGASLVLLGLYVAGNGVYQKVFASGYTKQELAETQSAAAAVADRPLFHAGARMSVKGVNLKAHPYSLFIVTSPTCSHCANSAGLHRRVIATAKRLHLAAWVAVPTSSITNRFLATSGLQHAPTIGWASLSRRFIGTPSIVLVDSAGIIRKVWLGELGKVDEENLFSSMSDPAHVVPPIRKLTSGEAMLTGAQLEALRAKQRIKLISVLERDKFAKNHPDGAIDIPLAELYARAELDLTKRDLNVIDCGSEPDVVCSFAVDGLRRLGFRIAAADLAED